MKGNLKIHAIVKALNEEHFIVNQLKTLYPFCDKISVLTQYDRDWYGKMVVPDKTVPLILDFPDPEGKIHISIRKFPDETSGVNMEMLSFSKKAYKHIIPHGSSLADIAHFHSPPDYFWYVDADEIYDVATIPALLEYLEKKRPRGLRVTGYNYIRTWNQRIPRSVIDFTHFGFIKAGVLLEQHRTINWNEARLRKLCSILHLPDISGKLFGFAACPESVAVFHHGCWLGDNNRLASKFAKSSHTHTHNWEANSMDAFEQVIIPNNDLPRNIVQAQWPANYFLYDQ